MKVLITGGNGQLGRAIQAATHEHHEVISVDHHQFDITDRELVDKTIDFHAPDIVINCAAYTNVDGCVENFDLAYKINAIGPQYIALACLRHRIPIVQPSTNEVFDGTNPAGYREFMQVNPKNAYAITKAAGEFNVRSVQPRHYILRTAWLFAETGRNFIHAILRFAKDRGELRVVTDEIGNPTYAKDVGIATAALLETGQFGTYHFVNEGACSRWEFANEILAAAGLSHVKNNPILSREFKRASTPPAYGHLHNHNAAAIGIRLRPWQEAVREFVDNIEPSGK